MLVSIIIILLFFGLLFIAVEITKSYYTNLINNDPQIIYKYIPRTFEEDQLDPISVSDIFSTMFSQPSPWIGSIRNYDRRKQEKINKYFVNQL